jgi:DNA-binding SARP family transcriptional activator
MSTPSVAPKSFIKLQVFGSPALRRVAPDGTAERLLGPGKPLALLVHLHAAATGPIERQVVASLFWPSVAEGSARNSLRQTLFQLRSLLGTDAFESQGGSLRLTIPLFSDLEEFTEALASGNDAAAVAVYQGQFLDSVRLADSVEAEHWLLLERRRYQRQFLSAAHREVDRLVALHHWPAARGLLERAIGMETSDLTLRQRHFTLLADSGDTLALDGALTMLRLAIEDGTCGDEAKARRLIDEFSPQVDGLSSRTREAAEIGHRGPLFGRTREVQALLATWRSIHAGRPRALLLTGEPGSGKTRLLDECTVRIRSQGGLVIACRGTRRQRLEPHAGVAHLIQQLFALPGALGIGEPVLQSLASLVPDVMATSKIATQRDPAPSPHVPLFEAIADLICAVTDEQPIVMILDDLHWMDGASQMLIGRAISHLPPVRLLLVAASRHANGLPDIAWESMPIGPLDDEALGQLIVSVAEGSLDESAVAQVRRWGAGLPLRTRHLIHHLIRQGLLERTSGAWRTVPDGTPLDTPPVDLTRTLTERLPSDQRRLLLYLALTDTWVEAEALHAVSGPAPSSDPANHDTVLRLLEPLEQIGLVHRDEADRWRIDHDEIAQRLLEDAPEVLRQEFTLHIALRHSRTARSVMEVRRTVRLFLDAGASRAALAFIQEWHATEQVAARGHALAELLLSERADTPFGREVARVVPTQRFEARMVLGTVLLTAILVVAITWHMLSQPDRLLLANVPHLVGGGQMGIPPLIEVHDLLGRVSSARDGQTLRLLAFDGADSITGIDRTPILMGSVMLDSMRVWGAPVDHSVSLVMEVVAGDGVPLKIRLNRPVSDSMWLEAGLVNGIRLDPRYPTVTVQPGGRLRGSLRIRYTEPYGGVLAILSQFTSWRKPVEDTLTVASLLVPVDRGFLQREAIDLLAPRVPGEYWLVWMLAFEPAAIWVTSATSWRCQEPVWGNSDDLSALPPHRFRGAWGTGRILHAKLECPTNAPRYAAKLSEPAVAIRVVVK